MEPGDYVGLGQMISDEAMQWYVVTHPGAQVPTQNQGEIRVPGINVGFNTNLLIVGLIVLGAVLLLARD